LRLLFLQTIKSSSNAKLCYVTLKLDECYIETITGSRSMHNGKWKIAAQNTRKVSVLASLRLSIEYKIT
jgi:hypothetical protein